jgi:hypothetical protein
MKQDFKRFPVVPPRPSVPLPYLAGTLTLQPMIVYNLLELIWNQINRDCPGTSKQLRVWADPANKTPVYVGQYAGKPIQRRGAQSVWDGVPPPYGKSVWDGTPPPEGKSQWDKEFDKPNVSIPGQVSPQHFGYFLTPMGEPRIYQSAYPGDNTPIGHLQVFSQALAKLHVEVNE